MFFEIVGEVTHIQIIAEGRGVQSRKKLQAKYGGSKWRKMKGNSSVLLLDGSIRRAEIHWYEAHGIGKRDYKIKRYLD